MLATYRLTLRGTVFYGRPARNSECLTGKTMVFSAISNQGRLVGSLHLLIAVVAAVLAVLAAEAAHVRCCHYFPSLNFYDPKGEDGDEDGSDQFALETWYENTVPALLQ